MPADTLHIAVVGHTNAGKTSLLRTLTRRTAFGEVADRPGTTRHVEAVDLDLNGAAAIRFYDTPGLEDAVTLLEYLRGLEGCNTPVDRIRAFLRGPEAHASFEQEAKVLRKMLEVDAAICVIDCREPVLPKFSAELEILSACGRPVMPVLNFVRSADSREPAWQEALAAFHLHVQVRFDAVAPGATAEQRLYRDLAILLRDRRAALEAVADYLDRQSGERRQAACRAIAASLLRCAAMRRPVTKEEQASPGHRERLLRDFRAAILREAHRAVDDMLAIYGFRQEDLRDDETLLPWREGRWESDLFDPEILRDAGRKLGAGAAAGAAAGLAADVMLAGLSLGSGMAIGAALGGIASQGWGPFGRRLANRVRGLQELTVEDEVLLILCGQMLDLLRVLEGRGHAATEKIRADRESRAKAPQALRAVVQALRPARSHPEWAAADSPARDRCGDGVAQRLLAALAEAGKEPAAGPPPGSDRPR